MRTKNPADVGLLETQLERFFRADNDNGIARIRHWAKKTNSGDDATPLQEAWLYRVMQIAEAMDCRPYSSLALPMLLTNLSVLCSDRVTLL
jgi:HTH-type transcriptional regulator / antitoxin HigA